MSRTPYSANRSYRRSISLTAQARALAAFLGSTTTGVSRWGSPLYWPSSTRLGSTRISRTWSGVARIKMEVISELMHEDLPVPVAPEISTWGIWARLTRTARPAMSRPSATSSGCTADAASGEARMSPKETSWRWRFGTSTPMADFPGMGARIRTSGLAMA